MRPRLLKRTLIPAALAVTLTTTAVVQASAAPQAVSEAAATTAGTSAQTQAVTQAGRAVFLPTGQVVAAGAHGLSVLDGAGSQLETTSVAGQRYAVPTAVTPYLGHGLDPGLFDPARLAWAESGGRLPVQVTFTGHAAGLPGLIVTAWAPGLMRVYLTSAGARTFGIALGRLAAADRGDVSYGQNGFLSDDTAITLAGDPSHSAREAATRPQARTQTLTVRGTDLAGKPDNGDTVRVLDADNLKLLPGWGDTGVFRQGVATFSVPAGHFWVLASFYRGSGLAGVTRLDVLPEVTVTGDTTVTTSAAAATSKLQFVTARPATVRSWVFRMIFQTYQAPAGCCTLDSSIIGAGTPPGSLYVSPMATRPGTGTLTQVTQAELASPTGARGVPYVYSLADQASGVIPAQRFVVRQDNLATQDAGFYASAPHTGYLGIFPRSGRSRTSAPSPCCGRKVSCPGSG